MPHRALRPVSLLIMSGWLASSPGCTCGAPSESTTVEASSSVVEEACTPLAETNAAWRTVKGSFFTARMPSSWKEAPGPDGSQYRDNALHRKLELAKVEVRPGAGVSVAQVMETLMDGVRSQAGGLASDLTLGPTRKHGTEEQPIRFFLVTARGQYFVAGLVGRSTKDGAFRGVSVTYADEDPDATPSCTEQAGLELLATIQVPDDPIGPPASAALHFTPAAIAELRRELQDGEVVWIAVKHDGANVEHVIEVRNDLPEGTATKVMDGIPVAIDPASEGLIGDATVDHVAGRGFRVDHPAKKP